MTKMKRDSIKKEDKNSKSLEDILKKIDKLNTLESMIIKIKKKETSEL